MTLSRRSLLRTATALAAAGSVAAPGAAMARRSGRISPEAISIQLYTLRDQLAADVAGTLRDVAEIGYRSVETAGTHGRSPAEFRAILDRVGLRATSGHHGLDRDVERIIADAHVLGHRSVVVPYADFATADEWRAFADRLNDAGRRCRDAGLVFGYHNHDQEFAEVDGVRPFDVLLERTDPRLVGLELDLYWVAHAGQDPVALVEAQRDRIDRFHVKDRAADGAMADPGTGTMDFPAIFARGAVREYVVEHDNSPDPLRTARVGHQYLSEVRW
ncbi:sugar phosphate isomerase/epimerase family protein [Saccharopolyspora griseoalba]|uniref:Sugar phosphate isomerase/epimerase family protein n=1 Tax=Saccharopolyspora griseoalba TaxID=1431848 RepID=A0ABW2LBJ3_9PSEU